MQPYKKNEIQKKSTQIWYPQRRNQKLLGKKLHANQPQYAQQHGHITLKDAYIHYTVTLQNYFQNISIARSSKTE